MTVDPLRIGMYHCLLPAPGRKPGGVEVFVDRLARSLTERGHTVTVHTFSTDAGSAPYTIRPMRPRRAGSDRLVRQYLAPWLLNLRPRLDYDVFHFHGDDWFCLRRPLPTIRTFHGSALLESLTAPSLKRRVDKAIVFPLELLAGRLADARYGVGSDSRLLYRADGILRIGVDAPTARREPSLRPSVLFIGTWEGRKRGKALHAAFQRMVRARHPQAELWMVSDHCEPGPGVTWYQHPSDAEVQALLRRAWAFSLPSSYEGFGIPYLEAMAWGVPVVATPNPGADDLLRDGDAGLIVELDDLGDALAGLLSSQEERVRLEKAGRARAAEFTWEAVCAAHEHAYALARERWHGRRRGSNGRVSAVAV
jgi:phosphatidyl-myo-inositol alpha-mannosyltransferase